MDEQLYVLVYFSIILFGCVFTSDLQEAKLILIDLPFPFEMSLLHAKERGFYVLTKQSEIGIESETPLTRLFYNHSL